MNGLKSVIDKYASASSSLPHLLSSYRDGVNVSAFGLNATAQSLVTLAAIEDVSGLTLVITPDFYSARQAYENISFSTDGVVLLPERDDVISYRNSVASENVIVRYSALNKIVSGNARVVVTSIGAIMQIFPHRDYFSAATVTIEVGGEYAPSDIVARLIASGYQRGERISDVGTFSLRGDILDVWSPDNCAPVRIEFFGDEVESVRVVDSDTHRSRDKLDRCVLSPVTEYFATEDEARQTVKKLSDELDKCKLPPDNKSKLEMLVSSLISCLDSGDRSARLSYLLPYAGHDSAPSFIRPDRVIYYDAKYVVDNATVTLTEAANRYKIMLTAGEATVKAIEQLLPVEKACAFACPQLAYHSILSQNRIFQPQAVYTLESKDVAAYHRQITGIERDLLDYEQRGYTVYFAVGDDERYDFVFKYLREHDIYPTRDDSSKLRRSSLRLKKGVVLKKEKLVFIGENDLVYKTVKKKIRRKTGEVFYQPEAGDYVVHEFHGIGRFEGLVKLEVGGLRRDYALVAYDGTDKLYVPVENLDCLSKYSAGESVPKLSKIGGKDFARVKEKVAASVKELAIDLVDLYGKRLEGKGYRYSSDDSLLDEFVSTCEFVETDDQLTAVDEAISDLKKGKIMDRLLCGDVGYGKTEVALRVAFKVIAEGKQVAFMSPTTILAKQHYETAKRRMENFGITVARMTRFDGKIEQEKTVAGLKAGKIDIVVGTHRLLSKDVGFADLGLLILDEEQRFGVADKEKIKTLRNEVNVLTLSATPIPRTPHMSLVGIRDISTLDTPPTERIPVQTYVTDYSETLVVDAVSRELNRGGQTFIVYNRVENMPAFAARIAALLPSARVTFAHGQMDENTLEKRVENFVGGEYDVMISSTIIENGIDIPLANTMIVVDSDRLGLSQLYQLRGRVGRSNRLAYVYFTYDGRKILSDNAAKRLDAISEFTEFGSGFKIAMRDLEIRGAGAILGAKQHGHMEKVGYDMYCKLLKGAVQSLRGEEVRQRNEVRTKVDYAMYLPDSYIVDKTWRMRVYSKIASVSSLADRENLIADMTDIYGPVPDSVKNLVDVSLIKNLAADIGADGITLSKREICVSYAKLSDISNYVNEAAIAQGGRLCVEEKPRIKFTSGGKMLKFLLNCHKLKG